MAMIDFQKVERLKAMLHYELAIAASCVLGKDDYRRLDQAMERAAAFREQIRAEVSMDKIAGSV